MAGDPGEVRVGPGHDGGFGLRFYVLVLNGVLSVGGRGGGFRWSVGYLRGAGEGCLEVGAGAS